MESIVPVVGLVMIVLVIVLVMWLLFMPLEGTPPPMRRLSKYTREPDEDFKREVEREAAFQASFIKNLEVERELETGLRPKQVGLAGLLFLMTALAIALSIWKVTNLR